MELANFINQYKNKTLNILILILALIFANKIYKSQTQALEQLRKNKDSVTKKNAVLNNISQLEKSIIAYKNLLNKKDISLALGTISNVARDSGVQITSLKPQAEKKYLAYIKYPFDLTIEADNYHAIGRFIGKLERHPDIYIVEELTIKQAVTEEAGVVFPAKLTGNLKISTMLFKD